MAMELAADACLCYLAHPIPRCCARNPNRADPRALEVVVREEVFMENHRFLLKLLTAEAVILIAVYIVLASI